MGVCCLDRPVADDCQLHYASKLVFRINTWDFAGRLSGFDSITSRVTRPSLLPTKKSAKTSLQHMNVTSCVLPGFDPRGAYKKTCQDAVYWAEKGETLLIAVFDGHGDFGDKVASFCVNFIDSHFEMHFNEFFV